MWTQQNIADQSGKTVIVTGGNTGIGYETALALYKAGATVIIGCRDKQKADKAVREMRDTAATGSLEVIVLDLSSLQSIKEFSDTFRNNYPSLDLLINNAGVMTPPPSKTIDGYELQFGVNFLGHFALTGQLYPLLKSTAGSRVVTVTSLAYRNGKIDFDNLKTEKGYDAFREYCQSKLACLLFTSELQKRIDAKGDTVVSLASHPGVTTTDLSRHMSPEAYNAAIERFGELMPTAQGALPGLYAAVSDSVKKAGLYGPDSPDGLKGYPAFVPVEFDTDVPEIAKQLWEKAEQITAIVFP